MKPILLLAFALSLSSTQFAQAQKQPAPQNDIAALQEINDQRIQELNSLESLYTRISAEVILINQLIENISNGVATRQVCAASCNDGTVLSCTGIHCYADDGVGCGALGGPTGPIIKSCPSGGGGPVGVSAG